MMIFIAVCLGILTLIHIIAICVWVATAVEVRRAAQAVEVLAYRAQDQVARLNEATAKVRDFTSSVRSGWMKALAVAVGAAATFWSRRKNAEKSHDGAVRKE